MVTATPENLEVLRNQHEAARLRAEIAQLETSVKQTALLESWLPVGMPGMPGAPLMEAWGDPVDRHEWAYDSPGFGRGPWSRSTYADDRAFGRFRPFYENEQDLRDMWGIARILTNSEEVGAGVLENLTNYVLGTGCTYEVKPKAKRQQPGQLEAAAQKIVDTFIEANRWEGDLERELFQRAQGDGEFGLWMQSVGGGQVRARVVDPECVLEPNGTRELEEHFNLPSLCWSFGIGSEHGDSTRRYGYFVQWHGDPNNWDYVPANEFVHCPVNVPRVAKRGMSDFYAAFRKIEKASKLLGNTLEGGAIQAAIAYIRQHATGVTGSQIQAFQAGKADSTYQKPVLGGGTRTAYQQKFLPGTVLDVKSGQTYMAGPMGTPQGPVYVEIMQAALRVVGARWCMPEYMVSGDASNANYSSTLVSGAPFVRACENRQAFYRRSASRVFWRVLDVAAKAGAFSAFGIYSGAELKQAVDVNIQFPDVAIGDQEKKTANNKILHDAGILSPRTWAAKEDLDYEQEVQNGAKAVPVLGQYGAMNTNQDGEAAKQLNGAQITAAGVLQGVSNHTTSPIAAVDLLIAVGIDARTANRMVRSMVSTIKAQPEPQSQPAPEERPAERKPLDESQQQRLEQARALLFEHYP